MGSGKKGREGWEGRGSMAKGKVCFIRRGNVVD